MRIIHSDFKKGKAKLKVTSPEDLWHLSQIILPGDLISGKTVRKLSIGSENAKQIQKVVFLEIKIERVELSANSLRASGKVIGGSEDVPRGSYHTFTIEQNTEFVLNKEEWLSYHVKMLKEAVVHGRESLIICVFDREEALFARPSHGSVEILSRIQSELEKKDVRAQSKPVFYKEIKEMLALYDSRYNPDYIIIASPAFYKDDFALSLKEEGIKGKLVLATCSSANETAVYEVLKRPETQHALKKIRAAHDSSLVEKLLEHISSDSKATYGLDSVIKSAEAGAVSHLLVTDKFLHKFQIEGRFDVINRLMKTVEAYRGTVNIISHENDAGQQLTGLGGVAAILRYAVV